MWGGELERLAYPLHRPMTHSRLPREHDLPVKRYPVFVVVIVDDVCWGKEASSSVIICWWAYPPSYQSMAYYTW
jgi:hypothetical protein